MSIEALNWARKTHVGDSHGKSLLRAIADYADEHGHCWPSHGRLAADCEFSVATVKRRISQLEELGLLVTFRCWMDENGQRNKDERGRETSREIRLSLGKVVSPPIVGDEFEQAETESAGGAGSTPQTQNEGVHAAPHGDQAAPSREPTAPPPSSHVTHPNEPSSNKKDSPPTPSGGSAVVDQIDEETEPEHFAEFWQAYPEHEVMATSRPKALATFRSMSVQEREQARAAAQLLAEQLRKMKRRPKNAHLWLQAKGWQQYPNARLPEKPKPVRFVAEGSAEHRAMRVIATVMQHGQPQIRMIEEHGSGLTRRSDDPAADYLAMAQFADVPVTDWHLAEDKTPQFFAWVSRLGEWTGARIEPQIIMLEGTKMMKMPFGKPDIEVQNRAHGLRVPCRWPPRKDGTLSPELETEGAS